MSQSKWGLMRFYLLTKVVKHQLYVFVNVIFFTARTASNIYYQNLKTFPETIYILLPNLYIVITSKYLNHKKKFNIVYVYINLIERYDLKCK